MPSSSSLVMLPLGPLGSNLYVNYLKFNDLKDILNIRAFDALESLGKCLILITTSLLGLEGANIYLNHKKFNNLGNISNLLHVVVSGDYNGTGCP